MQGLIRYGALALLASLLVNVYAVMRYYELHRLAARVEGQFQQLAVRHQAVEGTLREFVTRVNTDPGVLQILRKSQILDVIQTDGAPKK